MWMRLRSFGSMVLLGIAVPALAAAPQHRQAVRAQVQSATPAVPQSTQPPQTGLAGQSSTAQPPQVTFSGGELTISAPNSTLADVLNAVKAQTGAKLEIPPSASNQRVAVRLGPGSPRDILAQLLDGSPFDYILLGSAEQPDALTQIILTPHEGSGAMASGAQPGAPATAAPENSDEDSDNEPAAQAPQPSFTPVMPPEQAQPPATATPPNGQPGPANRVKTPEQLLQELQNLQKQEQQRQQQQQQNRPPQ